MEEAEEQAGDDHQQQPEAPVVTPTQQNAQAHAERAQEQHDLGGAGDQELGEEGCDALHSAGLGDDGAKRLGGQRTADHEGGEDRDRVTPAQGDAERARRHRLAAHGAAEGEGGQHDADADEEDDRIEARNVSQHAAESGVVVYGVGGEGQREDRRADQAFGDGHGHNPSILSIQCINYTPYK